MEKDAYKTIFLKLLVITIYSILSNSIFKEPFCSILKGIALCSHKEVEEIALPTNACSKPPNVANFLGGSTAMVYFCSNLKVPF